MVMRGFIFEPLSLRVVVKGLQITSPPKGPFVGHKGGVWGEARDRGIGIKF